ncbi:MAG: efflux RND transporter periplasmic adaptor subunit [Acidobacteria bacterium]|nr:efflux RND transporter periplasmic adaptor subunit [Acidobacteriota bacterium]
MRGTLLMVLALSLWTCIAPNEHTGRPQRETERISVAVQSIQRGDAASIYATTATLESESKTEVRARAAGVVKEIFVEEGDLVESGQLLLSLDDSDQALRLRKAEITLAESKTEQERRSKMVASGILSPEEFEQTENQLRQNETELELAQLALSYTRVEAPFDGVITQRLVDLGANVNSGTDLFHVMDVNPLLAKVYIPAQRMGTISIGQPINLHIASSEEDLTGQVKLISPVVDPVTGTIKVTVEIHTYPAHIRPGDFADVRVITAINTNAMLVPSNAVVEDQGSKHVFIAQEGRAFKRLVTVGYTDRGLTEIQSGLEGDEWVVVKGQRNLKDGVEIEVLEGAPTAMAEAQL